MSHLWGNIPQELRERPQWCVAGTGKEPLTLVGGRLLNASVTEPSSWMSFNDAATAAYQHGLGIGYVLNESDPYVCVDFDVKDSISNPNNPELWTPKEMYDLMVASIKHLNSYTEQSRSGKGFHVWVRGEIKDGARKHGIELYGHARFMICTGAVTNHSLIQERNSLLAKLYDWLKPAIDSSDHALVELPEVEDDWSVLHTAYLAANSDKFCALWEGDWSGMGYPSQSEADLALLSMLTFYSPSNAQVKRLFRDSMLGKREKAIKNDSYLNRTLRTIRARESAEQSVDISAMVKSADLVAEVSKERLVQQRIATLQGTTSPRAIAPLGVPQPAPPQTLPSAAAALVNAAPESVEVTRAGEVGIPWPPGPVGGIAKFIYESSYIPVKEVAIVGALGLMAGLCGRAWNIPESGLNLYIILIARSAIGKEGMHSGISKIVRACIKSGNPYFGNFVNFNDFASGPALTKATLEQPCFVNVSGEWGRKLKRLSQDDGRDQAMQTLRTTMTNLYQKSGAQAIAGGINYSQKDNNVGQVNGVAYSMIGESTPGTFYEALTENMMEDGFLSRFLCIEYTGDRVPANASNLQIPGKDIIDLLTAIVQVAHRNATALEESRIVTADTYASGVIRAFEEECRTNINMTTNESYRQMWNRASLKAQRVAALLAIGSHYIQPQINYEHITWAIDLVRRDISIMQRRIESGDVGMNDTSRERKMLMILRHYLENDLPPKVKLKNQTFKEQGVVTRAYLQVYASQSPAFNKFRGGAVQALNLSIQALIDNGYLAEVPKEKAVKNHGFNGKMYRILSLSDFKLEDIQ